MNGKEFIKAVKHITEEKEISEDVVFEGMEQALLTAYKKNFKGKTNVKVEIDRKTGDIRVYTYYVVVDEYHDGEEYIDEDGNTKFTEPDINEDAQVLLEDIIEKHPDAYLVEIAEEFNCSECAIRKALKKLNITRKKRQLHTKNNVRKK